MSNTGKALFNVLKKSSDRESNEGNRNIRRSRTSSVGMDHFSYLTPNQDLADRLNELERQRKEREREERERTPDREKRKKDKLEQRRERQRSRSRERRRNLQEKESERDKKLEQETVPEVPKKSGSGLSCRGKPKQSTESEEEFNQNIEKLEQQIENLDLRPKVMATMWISRLRAATQDEDEIRARNLITAHLLKCHKENIFLKEPFNLPPTSDTLANIKAKMWLTRDTPCNDMTLSKRLETKSHLSKLFHDSYDGGKFLSQLPVPRDGAFFILHMRPNL